MQINDNKFPTLSQRLDQRNYPKDSFCLMKQTWEKLLFLHWSYPKEDIQKTLPPGIYVDTFNDQAYISLVIFIMKHPRPPFFPPLPGCMAAVEVNVRTYVFNENGIPGIWFYSLDITNRFLAWGGRKFFHLPYHYLKSHIHKNNDSISYRVDMDPAPEAIYTFTPGRQQAKAASETLDFFLIERYVLFTVNHKNEIVKGRVHHKPYPISDVSIDKWDKRVVTRQGFGLIHEQPELQHFSSGVDVDIFNLTPSLA